MMGIIEGDSATSYGGKITSGSIRNAFCCNVQYKQAAWVVLNYALRKANAVPSSPDRRALATLQPDPDTTGACVGCE